MFSFCNLSQRILDEVQVLSGSKGPLFSYGVFKTSFRPYKIGVKYNFGFDVRKSVHHHTIQINQPTTCNSFRSLLLDVYVWLNMFRTPLRPSLGEYNSNRGL